MTHPILSMLPDEVRNLHFEEEVDALSRQISLEKVKDQIGVKTTRVIKALSARPRSAAQSKRSGPPATFRPDPTPPASYKRPQR